MIQNLQNLIWLWAILGFTIFPAVKAFYTQVRRQMLIAQIEKTRGSKVITMIHRQDAGILGALMVKMIDLDDSEKMMQLVRDAGDKPIDLVLHTPGGLVIAAEQITRVLHAHKPGVTVIVPQYAMSGGTMLCLAAGQILMDANAMLGPIDPQLNNYPASGYMKVLQLKDKNAVSDETIMMADMAAKATKQVQAMAEALLKDKLGDEKAAQVSTILSEGRWTHDYPLHYEQLRDLGLPVSTDIPPVFVALLGLSSPASTKVMRKVAAAKK
ncbi:MAG TPA: ATP-dependent Clp protease proteolytic subunit [Symbiobacteriaceae bacterium]|jgi:ClpP class serine protease